MLKNISFKFLILAVLLIGNLALLFVYNNHIKQTVLIPLNFAMCNENNLNSIWNIEINNSLIGSVVSTDTYGGDGKPVAVGSFCKTLDYSTKLTEGTVKITRISNGVSNTFTTTVDFTKDPFIYTFASSGIRSYAEKPQLID